MVQNLSGAGGTFSSLSNGSSSSTARYTLISKFRLYLSVPYLTGVALQPAPGAGRWVPHHLSVPYLTGVALQQSYERTVSMTRLLSVPCSYGLANFLSFISLILPAFCLL